MTTDTKNTNKHNGWNRVLIALFSILLVLACFTTVLRDSLANASKAYLFLEKSKAFENVAELTKDSVRANLPDKVKNNIIEKAIIDKLMDIVITPENIAKVAEPGLKALYNVSTKVADVAEKNISYNTTEVKQQAQKYLPSLGLPKAFNDASDQFINSVPDEIKILDVKNNPNSPLAIFLKIRNAYRTLNTVADILWILLVVNLLAMIALNIRNISRLLRSLAWSFGVAGVLSLILNYLTPKLVSLFMGGASDAISQGINNLTDGIVIHYFELISSYAWLYIAIAVVAEAGYFLLESKKAKELLSKGPKNLIKTIKTDFKIK